MHGGQATGTVIRGAGPPCPHPPGPQGRPVCQPPDHTQGTGPHAALPTVKTKQEGTGKSDLKFRPSVSLAELPPSTAPGSTGAEPVSLQGTVVAPGEPQTPPEPTGHPFSPHLPLSQDAGWVHCPSQSPAMAAQRGPTDSQSLGGRGFHPDHNGCRDRRQEWRGAPRPLPDPSSSAACTCPAPPGQSCVPQRVATPLPPPGLSCQRSERPVLFLTFLTGLSVGVDASTWGHD